MNNNQAPIKRGFFIDFLDQRWYFICIWCPPPFL